MKFLSHWTHLVLWYIPIISKLSWITHFLYSINYNKQYYPERGCTKYVFIHSFISPLQWLFWIIQVDLCSHGQSAKFCFILLFTSYSSIYIFQLTDCILLLGNGGGGEWALFPQHTTSDCQPSSQTSSACNSATSTSHPAFHTLNHIITASGKLEVRVCR